MSKKLFEEQQEEDYLQDLIFLQEAQYDTEREIIGNEIPAYKRLFHHNKFGDRRNKPKFVNKLYYPHNKLPF
jgi:hypothetical protein